MKKSIFNIVLPTMTLAFMSFSSGDQSTSTPQEQLANDGVKITCPEGDTAICFEGQNGLIVYKGKGEATIEFDR